MSENENGVERVLTLNNLNLNNLYAASYTTEFTFDNREILGLLMSVRVFLQDPYVAMDIPELGLNEIQVNWEPGLNKGPTSAKIAVVDYNGDTGMLHPPVVWRKKARAFISADGKAVTGDDPNNFEFHQVSVWAIIQRIIAYFEGPWSLGRPLPWGFEGNRLIVVPHTGYGENAYYDRQSKSLQFYYYGSADNPKFTCLSHDIIAHETGHAILDGIRPYYYEDTSIETGAFHEFIGDFTAILSALDINEARHVVGDLSNGMSTADFLGQIGEEFGSYVRDRPYLRSAHEKVTVNDVHENDGPHRWSQVLTSAMFKIFVLMLKCYVDPPQNEYSYEPDSQKQALAYATRRLQTTALHALDFLPPVDVRFEDYARAVLRAFDMDDPHDRRELRPKIVGVFDDWGILPKDDPYAAKATQFPYVSIRVRADMPTVARSRAAAYRFLDDNRHGLFIPDNQDIIVADLYENDKLDRAFLRLPPEIVIEYIWRESVPMEGPEFGALNGQKASLLCGGTLVFDRQGNVLSWFRKPGTEFSEGKYGPEETELGRKRQAGFLEHIKRRVKNGMIGLAADDDGSALMGDRVRPVTAHFEGGALHFERTPHLSLADDEDYKELGGRAWLKSY